MFLDTSVGLYWPFYTLSHIKSKNSALSLTKNLLVVMFVIASSVRVCWSFSTMFRISGNSRPGPLCYDDRIPYPTSTQISGYSHWVVCVCVPLKCSPTMTKYGSLDPVKKKTKTKQTNNSVTNLIFLVILVMDAHFSIKFSCMWQNQIWLFCSPNVQYSRLRTFYIAKRSEKRWNTHNDVVLGHRSMEVGDQNTKTLERTQDSYSC
jgi:hypothetical protein